jgi:hypothetical protein
VHNSWELRGFPSSGRAQALTPAAKRALEESQARRREIDGTAKALPKEQGGRCGLEPGRYGDWEVKGLTSDL